MSGEICSRDARTRTGLLVRFIGCRGLPSTLTVIVSFPFNEVFISNYSAYSLVPVIQDTLQLKLRAVANHDRRQPQLFQYVRPLG